jgi:putative FmdB family regulatory protein
MPTYLYECSVHGEFEEYHSMSKILQYCPKCEEAKLQPQKLKQLINCLSIGTVELTGQDLVDKCKSDAQLIKKDAAAKEKVYANLLGEDKYQALQVRMDNQKRDHRR